MRVRRRQQIAAVVPPPPPPPSAVANRSPVEAKKAPKLIQCRPSQFRSDLEKQLAGEYPRDEISGAPTGWECVDKVYKPVKGELTVITGMPGCGKSNFITALAANCMREHGWKIGSCLLEHRAEETVKQVCEKYSGMNWADLKEKPDELQKVKESVKRGLFLVAADFVQPSVDQILARAQVSANKQGMDGLIIDPYNYISQDRAGMMNETEYVSAMLSKLRAFATENKCHIWLIAHPRKRSAWASSQALQLTKNVHKEAYNGPFTQPGALDLYEISGSAHFYNKCDMGLVIERVPDCNRTTVRVLKVRNRDAGVLGSATLCFERNSGCYYEEGLARDELERALCLDLVDKAD